MKVRPASNGDLDSIIELCLELGYDAPVDEARSLIAGQRDYALFVAEAEGAVVGWIETQLMRSIEGGRRAIITGLVVGESARRLGVGRALVEASKQWAKEQGLTTLRVRTKATREVAPRFYESLGFTESKRQIVFDIEL